MAGKRGMKHLRGKTKEERDEYALLKMEQFIDTHILYCEGCKSQMQLKDMAGPVATMMMKRYDKLRPSLSSSEVKLQVETMSDVLKRISDEKIAEQHAPEAIPLTVDCGIPHADVVTH